MWVNRTVAATVDKGLKAIGAYLLRRFFHDDPALVSSKSHQKAATFRTLADHPDLQLSRTTLHVAVRLAVQERQLLETSVPTSGRLGHSHRVALLGVKDMGVKQRLVEETVRDGLTVRELRQRVDDARGKSGRAKGPEENDEPRVPRAVAALAALDPEKARADARITTLTARQRKDYRAALVEARGRLSKMIRLLDRAS